MLHHSLTGWLIVSTLLSSFFLSFFFLEIPSFFFLSNLGSTFHSATQYSAVVCILTEHTDRFTEYLCVCSLAVAYRSKKKKKGRLSSFSFALNRSQPTSW
ncbi:hypothetical protein BD560DRAFT_411744 [Blakeslea trispora]|nr:hypothetical protein BD560DRAFT_411744 [Blakeslea trispora]